MTQKIRNRTALVGLVFIMIGLLLGPATHILNYEIALGISIFGFLVVLIVELWWASIRP